MNRIRLTEEQFKLFEQGSKIDNNGEKYYNFPFWVKKVEKDIYEIYSTCELPIHRPRTYSGLRPNKYVISKNDGSKIDPHAWYFVLRIDQDPHARNAALSYVKSCMGENPTLALDLLERIVSYDPNIKMTIPEWKEHHPGPYSNKSPLIYLPVNYSDFKDMVL